MTRLARVVRRQLQLPLEKTRMYPHPVEQMRHELIEALADLLQEALGEEAHEQEVGGESEDHV
jgi:hypothetical protein